MSVRSLPRCIILFAAATASAVVVPAVVPAGGPKPPVNRADAGVALKGYDPVAYAVDGMPLKGNPRVQHQWNGAVWHFSSAENRDRFAREPEKYAPQFGGYCSYAVSRGYTADIDPDAWKIVNGKLYLNYSKRVQRLWERDMVSNIAKGHANWPEVLNK